MVITKTPFRISFFGGSTDLPVWYEKYGGATLSTTIDKYCYITVRHFPPFFPIKHRVVWSEIELTDDIADIKHPSVRETLKHLGIEKGMEIHHQGDLPARSGLGSSSSFTVGLLHALYKLLGRPIDKMNLAKDAIHIEQHLIKESVGVQDQMAAAFGGLNKFTFTPGHALSVEPVMLSPERSAELQKHLMLVFTGMARTASEVEAEKIKNVPEKEQELHQMQAMVDKAVSILKSEQDIKEFGKLLHETWMLKRGLTSKITNSQVDSIYDRARAQGAIGGKLLGAGSGGFMLLFVPPEKRQAVREALKDFIVVPFNFETKGSQVIYHQPNDIHE
jgi:D-glycero-alpha-D-manno-heptose-7-phosphate kinase